MAIDRTSWFWQKGRPLLVSVAVLLIAGGALSPVQDTVWSEARARQAELNLKDIGDSASHGLVLGVLGGFRSIIADFVWINGYNYWQHRDRAGTEASIRLSATLDPQNIMFWDEGSAMLGLDMPSWGARDLPNTPEGEAIYNQWVHDDALVAVDFLKQGVKFRPGYTLYMDLAQMYNRLNDKPNAAEAYRMAADLSNIPYLPMRCYVRLLIQMGQDRKAYDYLLKAYPNLPANVPPVQRGLLWGWIRGLEDRLKLPADQRLPDSMTPPGWKAADYMDDFHDMTTYPAANV